MMHLLQLNDNNKVENRCCKQLDQRPNTVRVPIRTFAETALFPNTKKTISEMFSFFFFLHLFYRMPKKHMNPELKKKPVLPVFVEFEYPDFTDYLNFRI